MEPQTVPDALHTPAPAESDASRSFGFKVPGMVFALALLIGGVVFVWWLSREHPERVEPLPTPQQLPGVGEPGS